MGIPTISISILRKLTEEVKPPRALFLKWPFGHPLGEAGNIAQQTAIIRDAFRYLTEIKEPGTIIDLPYKWKRETYPPVD